MPIKDSTRGYSGLSIALHWVAAITVITLYVLAEMAEGAPKEERRELIGLHKSIAMGMYIVLWARIGWRIGNVRPTLPDQQVILMFLSRWIPYLLLAALACLLISGPLMVWSNDRPLSVFDLFSIPSPLGKMEAVHEAMEVFHKFSAQVIYYAFFLHLAGVVKHLVIDRDNILMRMLKPGN